MKKLIAAVVVAAVLVVPAGASAATAAQVPALQTLKSTLRKDVKAALKNVRKLDLARVQSKGFTLKRIRALAAGRTVAVAKLRSATLAGGASTRKRKGMTVAKGSRSFAGRGRSGVRLKPSKAGSSLLRRASRITLDVKAVFRSQTGGRVTVLYKVTLKRKGAGGPPNGSPTPGNPAPPVPSGPIPANAQLQYFQTFDTPAPWSGLSTQCAHPAEHGTAAGDGYAHLEVRPGEPLVAGLHRCELSLGGYDQARPAGEYWYRTRIRTGLGFPFNWGAANFVTLQQWQEDRPPAGSGDTVDGALFVNSGPSERMYVRGEALPISQSGVFDINAWHDFIVHGVWTDQPNGYLEWWVDGTYVGRTTGVTSEIGGRHFWKGGITRSDGITHLQSADISNVEVWKMP